MKTSNRQLSCGSSGKVARSKPPRSVRALLATIRQNLVACESGLRPSAEACARLHNDHAMSERQIAEAVDMSPAWVHYLLVWQRDGYETPSPFTAQRAERKARVTAKKADEERCTAVNAKLLAEFTARQVKPASLAAPTDSKREFMARCERAFVLADYTENNLSQTFDDEMRDAVREIIDTWQRVLDAMVTAPERKPKVRASHFPGRQELCAA